MPTPSAAASSLEMIRVVVSVPLPAANGSTSVMLRVGHAAVCAKAQDASRADATAATAIREVSEIIPFLLPVPFQTGRSLACAKPKRKRIIGKVGRGASAPCPSSFLHAAQGG